MKKITAMMIMMLSAVTLSACGNGGETETPDIEPAGESGSAREEGITKEADDTESEAASPEEEVTPITLTVGDTVLNAYLNDSKSAQSLLNQLPLTVTLNDSDNDFCGGSLDIEYSDSDVQYRYENGDLAFGTPASNFVIFVDGEENSAGIGDLVILGKVTEQEEVLDELEGTIDVTIARAADDMAEEEIMNDSAVIKGETKVKVTAGGQEIVATLEDNATKRALIEKLPLTLPMMDLYGREMCYRFEEELPTDNLRDDGYAVDDLAYWPPRHSFVILYDQNGEEFSRQHLGHIDSGIEIFRDTGDTEVTFELLDE